MSTNNTPRWWFILGHEPMLSIAEIFSVLKLPFENSPWSLINGSSLRPTIFIVNAKLDPALMINSIGGTIKIAEEIGVDLTENEMLKIMADELNKVDGKINFGISAHSPLPGGYKKIEEWGKKIKSILKKDGRSVRYVYKNEATLSSVTVSKNGLNKRGREFIVAQTPQINNNFRADSVRFLLAKTAAVQPFEKFGARDFGRPGRDDKSGMLPPKLALMMINLAGQSTAKTILDPFCGSGTILTESMLLGFEKIFGTDISEKAIQDSLKNIAWITTQLPNKMSSQNVTVKQGGVLDIQNNILPHSVDAIITEPYLGPPLNGREFPDHLHLTCQELGDLYLQAFTKFKEIIKTDGVIIFIIPRFLIKNKWYTISDKILLDIKKLGFTPEKLLPEKFSKETFLLYHRPTQFVGREIWKLKI